MAQNGAVDTGAGPPGGGPAGIPLDDLAKMYGGGLPKDAAPDAAFAAPSDPIDEQTRAKAKLVVREIPNVTVQNSWSVEQVRGALYAHMGGMFDGTGQLWDSILGDPRVVATLGSRTAGLFGREVRFKAANDSGAAKECLIGWQECWPHFAGDGGLINVNTYAIGMGFSPAQLVWNTQRPVWCPYLRPWHPRFTYWHWPAWHYRALAQSADINITPGDGKWVNHCPWLAYRGWVRAGVRAIAEPWMVRHFGVRDMARFSEVHGLPTRKGYVPAVGDPGDRAAFEQSLAKLGSDSALIVPRGVDGQDGTGYDYELVEAKDRASEVFVGLIDISDRDIVLALLFQNLTTEVDSGSFAATKAHMDIRQSGLQFDNEAWKYTLYTQVARPFAYLNYGDADLAPWTCWDVAPREDTEANAKNFEAFGRAIEVMARGGLKFKSSEAVRKFAAERFGLQGLPDFDIGDPASSGGLGG